MPKECIIISSMKFGSLMTLILLLTFLGLASTASAVTSITVVSPNSGENWARGTAHTVGWSSVGSPGTYVKLELLKNGVLNSVITSSTANDGSYSWTIPSTQTTGTDYKIRVTSTTNSAYTDTSNNNFIISAGTSLTVASPNGGENKVRGTAHTVGWSSVGSPGTYVKLELLKNGVVNSVLSSSTANDGSYSWTIPSTQTTGTDYKIRVTSTTNSAYTDTSNNNFIISAGTSLTVASPNGGENKVRGTSHTVGWSSVGSPGTYVKLELLKNGVLNSVITSSTANDGSYSWTIPSTQTTGTDYKIRVTSTTNSAYTDTSNNNFIISLNSEGAEIIINSDKTLNINGKKTFPVYMYSICNSYFELHNGGMVEPCNASKNTEFTFAAGPTDDQNYVQLDYKNKFEKENILYNFLAENVRSIPQELKNGPNFMGYYQPDEPTDDMLSAVIDNYNKVKATDNKHPVILNHWNMMTKWAPYTDIITWDIYPITDTIYWPRIDSIYAYEQYSRQTFFENRYEVNSISKPVWAVIQANGVPCCSKMLVPTPKEARANTYTAITMDVKGIGFWGYESYGGSMDPTSQFPYGTSGLYNNKALHSYYRQLARELVSLNDILVLPTKDYSWHYRQGTKVSFSKNLNKTVLWNTRYNFNYILKQSGATSYLIVVNKDSRPISNVGITILGLSGAMTMKTLGLETSGSGRAGRLLSMNNGKFIDSFDGYAVHIYKVS